MGPIMAEEKHDGSGVHSRRSDRDLRAGDGVGAALDNAAYWATQAQVALQVNKAGEAAFLLGRAQGWIAQAQARHQGLDELHTGDARQEEAQVSGCSCREEGWWWCPEHAE